MRIISAFSGIGLACLMAVGGAGAQQLSPDMPLDVANLPQPSSADWNGLAWQSFVAANWPIAAGMRGIPDPSQRIGAIGPGGIPVQAVWMTSKGISDVFLPQGAPPSSDWQTQTPIAACSLLSSYNPATAYVLGMTSKATTAIDQAPFPGSQQVIGPLIDQMGNYVRYDIRMSQSEFTYILMNKYYNSANQVAAVTANPPSFRFPPEGPEAYVQQLPAYARYGAVEYKASWRALNPQVDIVSRYFTAMAFMVNPDGTCIGPQLVGLTGLHVLRLTPSTPKTWFWATFEQVDNLAVPNPPPIRSNGQPLTPSFGDGSTTYPSGYSYMPPPLKLAPLPPNPPVGVSRVTGIQPDSVSATAVYQRLLAGTVWQNYQLIGVQFPVNPINPNTGQPRGTGQGPGQCYVAGTNRQTSPAFQLSSCYNANVTMETYVQSTSCATCHSYGTPLGLVRAGGMPSFPQLEKFQMFSFMLLQAQPLLAPPDRGGSAGPAREYIVGLGKTGRLASVDRRRDDRGTSQTGRGSPADRAVPCSAFVSCRAAHRCRLLLSMRDPAAQPRSLA
jgi:hypothetical protein